mmetsp:Transcript_34953/g.77727  ORF Transcript_34953/g.77727 Transcript_34953/m.77727 type:complete len:203 (+) Transcript_34953:1061-1669(+)
MGEQFNVGVLRVLCQVIQRHDRCTGERVPGHVIHVHIEIRFCLCIALNAARHTGCHQLLKCCLKLGSCHLSSSVQGPVLATGDFLVISIQFQHEFFVVNKAHEGGEGSAWDSNDTSHNMLSQVLVDCSQKPGSRFKEGHSPYWMLASWLSSHKVNSLVVNCLFLDVTVSWQGVTAAPVQALENTMQSGGWGGLHWRYCNRLL